MEEKKAEIVVKWQEVTAQMRVFSMDKLKTFNYKARYPVVSEKVENSLVNLLDLYEDIFT